jgi:hypothetical protein
MFNSHSKTGVGIIVLLISGALRYFGIEADEGSVFALATLIVEVIATTLVVFGQLDRKDLFMGLLRV